MYLNELLGNCWADVHSFLVAIIGSSCIPSLPVSSGLLQVLLAVPSNTICVNDKHYVNHVLSIAQGSKSAAMVSYLTWCASGIWRIPSPAVLFRGFHWQLASIKDDNWGDASMLQDLNSAHAVSHKPGNNEGEGRYQDDGLLHCCIMGKAVMAGRSMRKECI